jgi:hypothetical protein
MKTFTNGDDIFAELATNEERRAAAIISLIWRRNLVFWLAMANLVLVAISDRVDHDVSVSSIIGFVVTMCICSKFESDLRLLKIVDRLQGGNKKSN